MDQSRTEIIISAAGVELLHRASVAIFGIGGVGGYALEAIARAGVGYIKVFDYDRVAPSNCNRQILSLNSNIGIMKTEVAIQRVKEINPECEITAETAHLTPENIRSLIPAGIGYAIDAIDELDSKIELITELKQRGITFISSMGAGNRLDPSRIRTADISETSVCPLARRVRKILRQREIFSGVPCVFSTEEPVALGRKNGDNTVGSISYMPAVFGLTAAAFIIREIIAESAQG